MEWMILPFRRFANFSGRSRRKEFWMFYLLTVLLDLIARFIDISVGFPRGIGGPAGICQSLVFLIPSVSVGIRRLHDIDRSGWWLALILIPIIGWITLLIFFCTEGTSGENRFGFDSKNPNIDLQRIFR